MTKADIIQRLLDKKEITAEEAVVLLSSNELKLEKTYPTYHWLGMCSPWDQAIPNPYIITAETNKNK